MLRRFFAYYRPYKGLFALDFGSAVVAGLLELAFPLAVSWFIDSLLPRGNFGLILAAGGGLLAVFMFNAALRGVVNYYGHVLGVSIETDMRRQAFDHLTKLSFRFFDHRQTGQLITHVTKDLEDVGEMAHHGPEDVFLAVMTFLGAFALMFWTNWQLAAITVAIVPVVTWLISTYGARMTLNWQDLFRRVGEFNIRVTESLGGIRTVRAFANEGHERRLFEADNLAYRRTKLHAYSMMTASQVITYLSTRMILLSVLLAGAWFVTQGAISIGGFVAFLLLVDLFLRPIDLITAVLENYPKGIAGFRRFIDLLDTLPDIADRPGARVISNLQGAIAFHDVTFAYQDDRPVLQGLTLQVAPGETLAIVGPSGAGKTTLCALLPRFYEPDAGHISIDGIDIRDMTQDSLRAQIGIVQQDVVLFGTSLRDNIAYGRPGATDAEVMAAARSARLDDMIAGLPEGLDTQVGERGVKLSGGQKQRVSIARIFLRDPPILILDEATSALDSATELAIQEALAALSLGRTTIIIAHRLSTIRAANRILVLDQTGIAEQGPHAALLARGGAYARLHAAQFGPLAG